MHPDVAKMAAAAAAAAQAPISRAPAPAPNPYVLDPKDHPQIAQRAPIPEQIGRGGMVLGPRDANGGYMVSALWSKTAKNTDCSTFPLARPFARVTVNNWMAIWLVFFCSGP